MSHGLFDGITRQAFSNYAAPFSSIFASVSCHERVIAYIQLDIFLSAQSAKVVEGGFLFLVGDI